jgi:hypothetical protein
MPSDEEAEMHALLQRISPAIGGLLVRMMSAGVATWPEARAYRDEIVALNPSARTDEEQTALLFAFDSVMNRVEVDELIAPESFADFRNVRKADYLMMLNVQAMDGDSIHPVRLDEITRREVAAGRLAADDEFRQLALAGGSVLGEKRQEASRSGFFARLFGKR